MENYLIAVQSPHGFHALEQLSRRCESIHAIAGISTGGVQYEVWLVTSASMTLDQLFEKNNQWSRIRVSSVKFSIPIQPDELVQARGLLLVSGFDTRGMDDNTLKQFLEHQLSGDYSSYFQLDHTRIGEPVKVNVKLTKDFALPTKNRRSSSKQHKLHGKQTKHHI